MVQYHILYRLTAFLVFIFLVLSSSLIPYSVHAQSAAVKAFPEAEGFGAKAIGGRGGRVILVTNLSNSGTGSLRACVEASGPRTCVFRIGGTIELASSLDVVNPFLTIAGQTAPGGGITLKTAGSNNKGLFVIRDTAHNVIVRYLRSRPGAGGNDGDTLDALTINSNNVMIDHMSLSWGVDETLNTWYATAQNITVQWSIISEGLSNSIHPQGEHSKGFLMGGDNKNITAHHNLFAHNMDRHPEIKGDPTGILEAINNVAYNYGWRSILVSDSNGQAKVNIIGNYLKPGPSSPNIHEITYYNSNGAGVRMFVKGNIGPNRTTDANQQFTRSNSGEWSVVSTQTPDAYLTTTKFVVPDNPVTVDTAQAAYTKVLADSGNSKALTCSGAFIPRRDSVDTRIVNDVTNGTGQIIDSPTEVGGWPQLAAGTPCVDTDNDGIADEWEILHFGNLTQGSATASTSDFDNDGYTDLEEFLNGTNPKGAGTTVTPIITITTPVTPTSTTCSLKSQGDADCNGAVNLSDFEIFRKEITGELSSKQADFNADGTVTIVDFEVWRKTYLK